VGSIPHPAGDPSTAAPSRAAAYLAWLRCWSSANRPNPNAAIWQDTSSVYLKRNTPRTNTRNGIGGLASAHPSRWRSGTPTRRHHPVLGLSEACCRVAVPTGDFVRCQEKRPASCPGDSRRRCGGEGRPYGQTCRALHLDGLTCTRCLWREMRLGSNRSFHVRPTTQPVGEASAIDRTISRVDIPYQTRS
jgi:hypothetical protein